MKKVLVVEGMMCAHCQAHVQKALEGVDGVQEAVVDLEKKTGHGFPCERGIRSGSDGCGKRRGIHPGQLYRGIRNNQATEPRRTASGVPLFQGMQKNF